MIKVINITDNITDILQKEIFTKLKRCITDNATGEVYTIFMMMLDKQYTSILDAGHIILDVLNSSEKAN